MLGFHYAILQRGAVLEENLPIVHWLCSFANGMLVMFCCRTPKGHAILAPHLLRFDLYLLYILTILGKVLMPIITFVFLSDIEN